ncbi:MAG: YggS family pyridoxal phosphate-dependent enzyme [Clostridia bacterium]|nr:YggS family pyridoxal phosphate-dependent enzyme [Clostridia bacterium]
MTEREYEISENYKRVTSMIGEAVARRGGGDVTLLGATKTVPAEDVLFAASLGLRAAGENKPQEFRDKYGLLAPVLDYQFIGHLQRNKAKYVVGSATLIHSVDSLRLAEEIDRLAKARGTVQDVLMEINIGREESKSGFLPEDVSGIIDEFGKFSSLNLRGIMTMAPVCEKKDDYRKYFQETYTIFIDIYQKKSHNIGDTILSMGMSDSFVEAIEEGSTLVRVGSAIFGRRVYP